MIEERFYLISMISSYVYLKEKYDDLSVLAEDETLKDLDEIYAILRPLEKYLIVPDKKNIISKAMTELSNIYKETNLYRDKIFLSKIAEYSKNLEEDEKIEILNILIYVTMKDKRVSTKEKEAILQVAKAFGINYGYNELIKNFENSELYKSNNIILITILIFSLALLGAFSYFEYKKSQKDNRVNIFNEKKISFSQVFFNRFVIYKNKVSKPNEYFRKEAVFYISGEAEVSFNPDNIVYDSNSKKVTYILPKDSPFNVEIGNIKSLLVDEIEPKPINKEDARKYAVTIGIAGGILGSYAGGTLASLYSNPMNLIGGTLIGGLAGGLGSGIVAFKSLEGKYLSKKITLKEKREISDKSIELIKALLKYNSDLVAEYKKSFVHYIKRKYAYFGKEVVKVEFDSKRLKK
jgi:hypothetical protein